MGGNLYQATNRMASWFLLIGLFLPHTTLADHWGYRNEESDIFPRWGGMCETGRSQSPINLHTDGALIRLYDDLDFHNYEKSQDSYMLVNNGHTVQLSKFPIPMTLSGGPLNSSYVMEQIHFHWWSEHLINNARYPLEAHFVHWNTRYGDVSTAARYKDGLVVLGILYHLSYTENSALAKVTANIDLIDEVDEINRPVLIKDGISIREFFPTFLGRYLTYSGSLTTPSCAESVTWIVLRDTYPTTQEQINQLKSIQTPGGKPLKNNYRPIQHENDRDITYVQYKINKSAPTSSVSSSIIAFIVSIGAVGLRRNNF